MCPASSGTGLLTEPPFTTSGTQLVTGGLGGLGPLLAEWLLQSGAERVVLIGRTARPGHALPESVETMLGDVAKPAELARVIAAIDAAGPPLRGVFHLAGVLGDAGMSSLRPDDLERLFAAKVTGARNLDALFGVGPLDAFVLFGSSVGLVGNAGQAAHAAANAYLAALAKDRHRRGLAGLCVDWGASGRGRHPDAIHGRRASRGRWSGADVARRRIARARAGDWLGEARIMIAALDWARLLAGYGGSPPAVFADVAPPLRTADAAGDNGDDPRAHRSALAAFVAREARRVLHVGEGEALAPDAPLNEAGLDSLMALELRRALAQGTPPRPAGNLVVQLPDDRCPDSASRGRDRPRRRAGGRAFARAAGRAGEHRRGCDENDGGGDGSGDRPRVRFVDHRP